MKGILFRFLFLLAILSAPKFLWAVAGDDCATAILVSSNGCSGATAYNNTGITGTLAPPSCFTGGNNNGMWFTFVASSPTVNVTVNAGTLTQLQISLLSPATFPCTGLFLELGCSSVAVAPATLSYSALTPGNTYYVYVDGRNNQVGTFQLCLNSPLQPGNDNPCTPFVVPAANFCSGINAYTNAGATADNLFSVSFPACWNSTVAFNTVWFRFTAIGAYNTITVNGTGPSGLVQPQVAIISTGNCNGTGWSSLGASNCGSATAGNNSVTINANNLIPGTTYYLAVDGVGGNTGAFQLCINSYTPSVTPVNDLCSGAIPLCPNGYYTGSTLNATNTGDPEITQWSCNAVVDNAVWYTFVTTNPVQPIVFNISTLCNADLLQFEVFDHTGAGTMCSTTTGDVSVGCTTFGPTGNGNLTLPAASLSPGRTYYVLIDNWPGDNCGFNFSISGNAGANAGFDQTVCLNTAAFNLIGTPAGGVWSGPGITNGALGTFNPSVLGLGTVTVFYTNGACVDQKIINITGPQVVVSNPVTICQGQSTNLQGTITPYPTNTT
ncbi:MAG: hypothetical protein NTY88_14055 [Bacteroidetes bacterium]|nr:hypothetical protein [Bacteroidota bacterium]